MQPGQGPDQPSSPFGVGLGPPPPSSPFGVGLGPSPSTGPPIPSSGSGVADATSPGVNLHQAFLGTLQQQPQQQYQINVGTTIPQLNVHTPSYGPIRHQRNVHQPHSPYR